MDLYQRNYLRNNFTERTDLQDAAFKYAIQNIASITVQYF